MRQFPLHKLTIRYNGAMFTYNLPCGSSPYINWLYGTMPQCLRTIYHAGVPLTFDYTVQCGSSPYNVYVRFTMREFPLHKLTIRYNATMFTYDLPCGSSPYINWLYGTMAQCLRTIYPLMRYNASSPFPLHKLTIRYNAQCLRTIYHAVVPLTLTIRYPCLRTIYHAGVPLT